ncbi:MAG TPA: zinc ribbon domain-containing protein [Burkholderiales bacterium]|nr:zinc ribbon domain-containing protein [Burkholderiales bacterium]
MPIYEYACCACGHEFETLVRNGEQPACANCASPDLEKKLSVFAAHGDGEAQPMPCVTCGHPGGPGSCDLN